LSFFSLRFATWHIAHSGLLVGSRLFLCRSARLPPYLCDLGRGRGSKKHRSLDLQLDLHLSPHRCDLLGVGVGVSAITDSSRLLGSRLSPHRCDLGRGRERQRSLGLQLDHDCLLTTVILGVGVGVGVGVSAITAWTSGRSIFIARLWNHEVDRNCTGGMLSQHYSALFYCQMHLTPGPQPPHSLHLFVVLFIVTILFLSWRHGSKQRS